MMKKKLLFLFMMLLPMVASAHDIEVANADGVTIYYKYINGSTELEVTHQGSGASRDYSLLYTGSIVIPSEVTYDSKTLKVTRIGTNAFNGCESLTSVTIPSGVTSIGTATFYGCKGLTSVTIPSGVTSIGRDAFEYCSGLTSIEIPNSVTSIGRDAFYECSGLTSVTIGNSVKSIGTNAFYNCKSLTSVTIL